MSLRVNPTGELPEALPVPEGAAEPNRSFLLDRDGIVCWAHIKAWERMTDLGKLPTEEGILAAARALSR